MSKQWLSEERTRRLAELRAKYHKMDLHGEIKKMQQQQLTIRLQVTDHITPLLRDMARQLWMQEQLAKAVCKSHEEHMRRLLEGFDARWN